MIGVEPLAAGRVISATTQITFGTCYSRPSFRCTSRCRYRHLSSSSSRPKDMLFGMLLTDFHLRVALSCLTSKFYLQLNQRLLRDCHWHLCYILSKSHQHLR